MPKANRTPVFTSVAPWSTKVWWPMATLGILLLIVRLVSLLQAEDTRLAMTTPHEEESLFSIWRFATDLPVYPAITEMPFSGSYSNILFYAVYGGIGKLALSQSIDLGSLPLVSRGVTLLFTLGLVVAFWRLLRECYWNPTTYPYKIPLQALAVILIVNSLTGWWMISAQPHIAALCFETIGIMYAVRYLKRPRVSQILMALLCFGIAFSFLQTHIVGAIAFLMALLWRRPWHALLATLLVAAYFWALARYGPAHHWDSVMRHILPTSFTWHQALAHLKISIVKFPILVPAVLFAIWDTVHWIRNGIVRPATVRGYATLLSIATFVWAFIISGHSSASDVAYLPTMVASGFYCILLLGSQHSALWASPIFNFGFTAPALACLLPLTGTLGSTHVRSNAQEISECLPILKQSSGPLLAEDRYLNLPWFSKHQHPNFVYSRFYREMPYQDADYAHGGIEGLIQQNWFHCILTPRQGPSRFETLARESGYRLSQETSTQKVWLKP